MRSCRTPQCRHHPPVAAYIFSAVTIVTMAMFLVAMTLYSEQRFLSQGGNCLHCRDTGAPSPLEVRCHRCGRWLDGYDPDRPDRLPQALRARAAGADAHGRTVVAGAEDADTGR